MHKINLEKVIQATPTAIWQLMTQPENDRWRSNVSAVTHNTDGSYAEMDATTGWPMTYTVVDQIPGQRLALKLDHVDGKGSRLFTLAALGEQTTRVSLDEDFTSHLDSATQQLLQVFLKQQAQTYLDDLTRVL